MIPRKRISRADALRDIAELTDAGHQSVPLWPWAACLGYSKQHAYRVAAEADQLGGVRIIRSGRCRRLVAQDLLDHLDKIPTPPEALMTASALDAATTTAPPQTEKRSA